MARLRTELTSPSDRLGDRTRQLSDSCMEKRSSPGQEARFQAKVAGRDERGICFCLHLLWLQSRRRNEVQAQLGHRQYSLVRWWQQTGRLQEGRIQQQLACRTAPSSLRTVVCRSYIVCRQCSPARILLTTVSQGLGWEA